MPSYPGPMRGKTPPEGAPTTPPPKPRDAHRSAVPAWAKADLPPLEVEHLDIEPGDHLVLRAPGNLSPDQIEWIGEEFPKRFPDNPLLILDGDWALSPGGCGRDSIKSAIEVVGGEEVVIIAGRGAGADRLREVVPGADALSRDVSLDQTRAITWLLSRGERSRCNCGLTNGHQNPLYCPEHGAHRGDG